MSAFGWVVGGLFVFVSWVLAVGWLLVGWLVVGCLLLIGGLSKANRHDIQYPPAHQTADTRATQTQHDLMRRSCVRCLVFGWWLLVNWLVVAWRWLSLLCWLLVGLGGGN